MVAREGRLAQALSDAALDELAVDYVFVDCPPSLGLLTVNALVAGDEVLIPIQCEYYALEGLGQLLSNIELVQAHLNPALHVSTILLTMYDGRTKLADQVTTEVRNHFGDTVLRTVIPRSVKVSEAPGFGQTVLGYDPGSRGAMSYIDAAREIAERGAQIARLPGTGGRRGGRTQGWPGARSGRADPDGAATGADPPPVHPAAAPGERTTAGGPVLRSVTDEPAPVAGRARSCARSTCRRSSRTPSSPAPRSTRRRWPSWSTRSGSSGCCSRSWCARSRTAASSWSWASAGGGPRSGPG